MTSPPPGALARAARLAATAAAVATVALVVATAGGRPWQAVASVAMIGLLPYVAFVALAEWARGAVAAEAAALGGLLLAVSFAVGLYALAFVVQPGPRTAAAPVTVPLLQSFAVGATGVAVALARWWARRSGRPSR